MALISSPSKKLSTRIWFLTVALILLLDLTKVASALKCYHCVCLEDCQKHSELTRECSSTILEKHNACITRNGPGKQVSKGCAFKKDTTPDGTPQDNPDIPGQKLEFCSTNLCNSQSVGTGGGGGGEGGSINIQAGNRTILLIIAMIVTTIAKTY